MRTKTLLLTVAACVAGVASSMAQVYSINTVGYVNVVLQGTNGGSTGFTLVANPLDNSSNTVNILLTSALANGSSVAQFNGVGFDGAGKTAFGSFGGWNTALPLPVGKGFFVKNNGPTLTNTFVGTVIPGPGGTNTAPLPNIYVMLGSTLPVGGDLLATGPGTLNLGPSVTVPGSLSWWNPATQAPEGAQKSAFGGFGGWNINHTFAVGDGFYVKSGTAASWVQVYP